MTKKAVCEICCRQQNAKFLVFDNFAVSLFSERKLLVVDRVKFSHFLVDNLSHRLCSLVVDNIWLSIKNSCQLLNV